MTFDDAMSETLDTLDEAALDALPFGVVGLDGENVVELYNTHEVRSSGLSRSRVVGRHFFFDVAPCMNNYLVAQRFDDEAELDVIVPYVLTLRMRPTPVKLRLLRTATCARRFLLVHR